MMGIERDEAQRQRTWLDHQRFRPQQWSSRERWETYARGRGELWYGFNCVRELQGLPPEILLVPLPAHTLGHAGVAVRGAGGLLSAHDPWEFEQITGREINAPVDGSRTAGSALT